MSGAGAIQVGVAAAALVVVLLQVRYVQMSLLLLVGLRCGAIAGSIQTRAQQTVSTMMKLMTAGVAAG